MATGFWKFLKVLEKIFYFSVIRKHFDNQTGFWKFRNSLKEGPELQCFKVYVTAAWKLFLYDMLWYTRYIRLLDFLLTVIRYIDGYISESCIVSGCLSLCQYLQRGCTQYFCSKQNEQKLNDSQKSQQVCCTFYLLTYLFIFIFCTQCVSSLGLKC